MLTKGKNDRVFNIVIELTFLLDFFWEIVLFSAFLPFS